MVNCAFTVPQLVTVELADRTIMDLNYETVEIIPAPGVGRCIVVRDVICLKAGTRGVNASSDSVHFALAFTDITEHELALTPDAPAVQAAAVFVRTLPQVFPDNDHGRNIVPSPDYPISANMPLKAVAIGEEDDWLAATGTLQAVTLTLAVRYEIMQITQP